MAEKANIHNILFLLKLNAQNVNQALQKLFRKVGKKSFKSIISDNGSKFIRLTERKCSINVEQIKKRTDKRISSKRKEYEQKREENTGLPFSKKVLF